MDFINVKKGKRCNSDLRNNGAGNSKTVKVADKGLFKGEGIRISSENRQVDPVYYVKCY